MSSGGPESVTRLLQDATGGGLEAARDLLPQVYDELRKLARARLRNVPPGATLQATALVHEAYMRVVGERDSGWDGRGHFFGAAALAMRAILVDRARRKAARKRGGGWHRVSGAQAEQAVEAPSEEILAVDEAIKYLEQHDPTKAQIINLRYFARMTVPETASAMGLSIGSVQYQWRYIRAWLASRLEAGESP